MEAFGSVDVCSADAADHGAGNHDLILVGRVSISPPSSPRELGPGVAPDDPDATPGHRILEWKSDQYSLKNDGEHLESAARVLEGTYMIESNHILHQHCDWHTSNQ